MPSHPSLASDEPRGPASSTRAPNSAMWHSLHADQARRQSFEECHKLAAAKLLSNDDLLGLVNPVNLKHVLGYIQTDRGNLHVDGSTHVIRLLRTTLWHSNAGSGRRPPHQNRKSPA